MSIEAIQKVGSFQGSGNVVYSNLIGAPTAGDLWFDYSNVALKIYNGTIWTQFGNSTGDISGVIAGNGLSGGGITGTVTLDLDFSELTDMTGSITGSTEFILLDNTTESRKAASEIDLSAFNNDSGWTDNAGTVTSVNTTGTVNGITLSGGEITDTGTVTLGGALADVRLDQLLAANVITSGESFVDTDSQVMTAAAINDRIESFGYTTTTGTVTNVSTTGSVNGITLTGGDITSTGTITLGGTLGSITLSQLDSAALITSGEGFSDTDSAVLTAAATDDRILSYGYTTNTGDITGVAAGAGLTGGGNSGSVTLNIGAGTGITVNVDDIEVDASFVESTAQASVTLQNVTDNGNSTTNGITVNSLDTTTISSGGTAISGSIDGQWTLTTGSTFQATYADLAEKYTTDSEYEAGTVMKFGGDAELTQSDTSNDHRVAGVVSTNPAYILNADIDGQYLALTGRVPVKVIGTVYPGDILVSSSAPGHAEVNNDARSGRIIGKAITADANGVCEALVTLM